MESRKPKQWSQLEEIHYHFFLILSLDRFRNAHKKNTNIFKQMQIFIPTKSAEQCRSHHQKRAEHRDIVKLLRNFYHDYYEIRCLDVEHSVMELRQYLRIGNPAFLNRNKYKLDLPQLLLTFEKNLQMVLSVQQTERKDQDTQTDILKQGQSTTIRPEVMELVFQTTQSSQFQLIVENCNSDIWQQL